MDKLWCQWWPWGLWGLGCIGVMGGISPAIAVERISDNPLVMPVPEVLWLAPETPFSSEPTAAELAMIRQKILDLNRQATAAQEANQRDRAWGLWLQSLRLMQFLPVLEELTALERLGAIAWEEERDREITFINERLDQLWRPWEKEARREKGDRRLSLEGEGFGLAQAYEAIHSLDHATDVYQYLEDYFPLDGQQRPQIQRQLAHLHLQRFQYGQAAPYHEQLLAIALDQGNEEAQWAQREILAQIYTALGDHRQALIHQEALMAHYERQFPLKVAPLKNAMAAHHRALGNGAAASTHHQEAFAIAWEREQWNTAENAVGALVTLYEDYDQPEEAISLYQELIKLQQLHRNYYGMMTSYDQLGDRFFLNDEPDLAVEAWGYGDQIGRSLRYNTANLRGKIWSHQCTQAATYQIHQCQAPLLMPTFPAIALPIGITLPQGIQLLDKYFWLRPQPQKEGQPPGPTPEPEPGETETITGDRGSSLRPDY